VRIVKIKNQKLNLKFFGKKIKQINIEKINNTNKINKNTNTNTY
jgi:hypothetical protein